MQVVNQNTTEKRLLDLAAKGNKNAFGLLYEKYLDEIYRFVYVSMNDQWEAEDITENAFIKAWEQLPIVYSQNSEIENFRAWLYRIARNLIVDHFRSKKPLVLEGEISSIENSPESVYSENNLSKQLFKAIMQLEPNYRQIIVLRFINQLSHKESANIMNLGYNNVRVLQYRALRKLRVMLSKEDIPDGAFDR
jgi:RNA polymerase sigma-70 factor (ECF subfamily)